MRAPSGQSLASGPVVSLAVTAVTAWLMRRQTSGWAVGMQSRNYRISVAQGLGGPESSISEAQKMASRRETGGMLDHGTLEEDTTVTWETLAPPSGEFRVMEDR